MKTWGEEPMNYGGSEKKNEKEKRKTGRKNKN